MAASSSSSQEDSFSDDDDSLMRYPHGVSAIFGKMELGVALPEEAPLTTIERERRQTEIELLADLLNGDKVVSGLKDLWFSERGKTVRTQMLKGDFAIGDPVKWEESERILTELVEEDRTYLEPYVRLSKLYLLQARINQAEAICKQVLLLRPWHFVAIETMIAVYAAKGDSKKVRQWSQRRLPTPSDKERRKEWVERALYDARASITRRETESQESSSLMATTENVDTFTSNETRGDSSWQ